MPNPSAKDRLITYCLTPLSWLYGAGAWVRNLLFDKGVLRQEEFDVPVVCVGNLSVGGTGKTPHVEFLLKNLASGLKVAVLSRGYGRRTKGFVLANAKSNPRLIGDEPMQIYQKFGPQVKVAVCESRTEGIRRLLKLFPDLDLIVLDDAFQHRYVKPAFSILLMDYARPIYDDKLLPLGRLRENTTGIYRAEYVVVTKCPADISQLDKRLIANELQLMPYQTLFFSRIEYSGLAPVFPDDSPYRASLGSLSERDGMLVVSGIANPRPLLRFLKGYPARMRILRFPDHHDFSRKDMQELEKRFETLKGERRLIITTEKDAVRLSANPYYPDALKPFTFYLPVSVRLIDGLENHDFFGKLRSAIGLESANDDSFSTPDSSSSASETLGFGAYDNPQVTDTPEDYHRRDDTEDYHRHDDTVDFSNSDY